MEKLLKRKKTQQMQKGNDLLAQMILMNPELLMRIKIEEAEEKAKKRNNALKRPLSLEEEIMLSSK